MAEYRIVAKVDPQTAAGTNKVKQDLRGVQQEAKATETALNRSFDQQKFERTIGALVNRIEQLDSSVKGLAGSNETLKRSNETLGQSLDRVAASSVKATGQTQAGAKATSDAASKNSQLESALMRVLRATDAEAAEKARLNALLADAKRLRDAEILTEERYLQVKKMVTEADRQHTAVTGAQRIGLQQLGFQLGDIATMYSLGARPSQIFASQVGQVSQALMLMGGDNNNGMLGKVANFLSGPWGIALTIGAIMLGPLVAKLFEGNDALEEAVEKLRKDAKETEINARAKDIFARSLDGVTDALNRNQKALDDLRNAGKSAARQALETAIAEKNRLAGITNTTNEMIRQLEVQVELNKERARVAAGDPRVAGPLNAANDAATKRIAELRKEGEEAAAAVKKAENQITESLSHVVVEVTEQRATALGRIKDKYEGPTGLIELARRAASADEIRNGTLARQITLLREKQKAEEDAAREAERNARGGTPGVATFRSREQAIGIAGREFQKAGLRVGENTQFGGVTGNHPGMGNSAHGRFAIDVNSGSGIVEADVPDLRAKFDAAARRYQARGYRVLWNGQVYEANGSGPTRRIPAGQNQHRDHMHLEAPQSIVGKATQASTEEQFQREEQQGARVQERAGDFVQAIVNRQASVGVPANRQAQLNAQIDEALAEFTRRFEREASPTEEATIRKAFTDADARETARRFDDAYVEPLKRLKELQGLTGIDREVMNAKLDETLRLGRELTPVEAQQIENGIRQGDQLQRQAQLLQQIRAPLEEYKAQIAALNDLLAKGDISQTSFNARLAEMAANAASGLRDLPGIDPGTGMTFGDVSATADENARYAKQLEDFQNHREQLLQMGVDFNALEEAAALQHAQNLAAIDQARKDQQLSAVEDIFGSLTGMAENMAGKQSAIYKAMFATEKAVAIARSIVAIQTGIAQASALPFPANLGAMAMVAAQTASIIANIRAVTLAFKDGGYVQGPGGPRSDSVPARLSNGEFVVNARATADNRPLLEAINNGQQVRAASAAQAVASGAGGGAQVVVQPNPAPQVNIRQINVTDPRQIADYLATPDGENVLVNFVNRNPELIARASQNGGGS